MRRPGRYRRPAFLNQKIKIWLWCLVVPVGMWAKAGKPVGNTCGQAVGGRSPSTGCPSGLSTGRAEGEPAGGRQAIVHISTGRMPHIICLILCRQ